MLKLGATLVHAVVIKYFVNSVAAEEVLAQLNDQLNRRKAQLQDAGDKLAQIQQAINDQVHSFLLFLLHCSCNTKFVCGVCSPGGGGGYSSEFLVGVCRPVPQILTQFQTKTCHFSHPFSDLAPKSYTHFQTFVVP